MIPGRPVAQQDLRTFFSTDATLEPTGSMRVAEDFFSKGSTFGDLANYLSSMFSMLEVSVPISHSKVQSSGGLFPPRALEKVIGHISNAEVRVLSGVCRALNSYHGTPGVERVSVSSATRGALEALAKNVVDSGLCDEKFEGANWERFLDVRTVDYKGTRSGLQNRSHGRGTSSLHCPPVLGPFL